MVNLLNKITPNEYEVITELRNMAIEEQTIDEAHSEKATNEYFLRYWEEAKQKLSIPFGDSLILEKKIECPEIVKDIDTKISEFTNSIDFINFKDTIIFNLHKKISINKEWNIQLGYNYSNIDILINTPNECDYIFMLFNDLSSIKNNCIRRNFIIYSNYPKLQYIKKFSSDTKLMKVWRWFAEQFNCLERFEKVRIAHSQMLNEINNQKVTLCLSIHPLDYMTASYNANNWRSCMCWDGGEYRRGVIEMMNSSCVVIAYIKSESTNLCINGFEWNSKKWREFFIVDENLIAGIKGYPYWNSELEREVIIWLRELYSNEFDNMGYSPKIINYIPEDEGIEDEEDEINLKLDFVCGPAMYNDFYDDNSYQIILSNKCKSLESLYEDYSGYSECIYCGEATDDFDSEGDLCCCRCIKKLFCSCCGDSLCEDDLFYVENEPYCAYCYNALPQCDFCTKATLENNYHILNLILNSELIKQTLHVCPNCENRYIKNHDTALTVKDITPEGRLQYIKYCPEYLVDSDSIRQVFLNYTNSEE